MKLPLVISALALFAAVAPTLGAGIGQLEGAASPTVSAFRVERAEPASTTSVRVFGSFQRVRPECSFVELVWELRSAARTVPVSTVFEAGARIRHGREQEFGPWLIETAEANLPQSYVVVYHQCPWRPWLVETVLWTGATEMDEP